MIIPSKFDGYVENVRRVYDGGGSSTPSTQYAVSDLPDWAKPYAQETLEKTRAVTAQPYQRYDQPRIAGFSPFQLQAQEQAAGMGVAPQVGEATDITRAAAMQGLGAQYQPSQFANQFQAPGQYRPGQFGMERVQAPELQQYQMAGPERVAAGQYQAPEMAAAQTGYRPDLQQFQMAAPERVTTGSFTQPGTAAQYMSPYIEQALVPQLREAQRASDILGTQQAGEAVRAGAFGGSRAGLLEAERQRNLATQMGDIRARGLQTAYEQAQGLYGTEAQRQLAAQQANQQAGLTAGGQNLAAQLGVQQLGTQTGLQTALANLSSQQQANVQNQAAQLQAQGLSAGQAMQAALANQQAGLTVGQQNLSALLGTQQFGAGQNLQAQLANQQALQQLQAAREASRQFGYGQQMQAAGLGAQYGQAAQQLAEQSRQYGAGFGLQGLQTALSGAGQLGNLGQTQYGQQMGINQLLNQYGAQQQALRQQGLSQAYQDFLNEQNYPYKQLGFMSDMIRGLPLGQQSTTQMYAAPANLMGQLGGIGMGLYGMSQLGKKEGGKVKEYADGGSVESPENVANIVSKLSDQQLAQAEQAAKARGDFEQMQAIMVEKSMRASERSGLAGAFNQLPYDSQEQMMAGGGIVAFAKGGDKGEETSYYQDPMGAPDYTPSGYSPFKQTIRAGEIYEPNVMGTLFGYNITPADQKPTDTSFDKAEEKRLSQPRTSTTTTTAKSTGKAPKVDASISSAITQMAQQSGQPEESLRSIYDSYRKSLRDESAGDMKDLMDLVNKSAGESKQIKQQALGKALAEFGFNWAAAASKPGAKFVGSAAAASPTLAASMAESDKLAREIDRNDMKLQMTMKQFQIAQRKGDMQAASALAAQERQLMQQGRQLDLQREQLAETARHHKAVEGISAQKATAGGAALKAYMTGQSKALDRARNLAKDEWGDLMTRKKLEARGITSYSQLYDYHKQRELKNALPIYGVTPEDTDED